MTYFELFEESPLMFFVLLLISFALTLLVYSAFPVIFAKTRKTPITKKKYKHLCYGINLIGMVFFVVINGAVSGAPYLLWTLIFSNYGVKKLEASGLLSNVNKPPKQNICDFCLQRKKDLKIYTSKTDESSKLCLCQNCAEQNNYF